MKIYETLGPSLAEDGRALFLKRQEHVKRVGSSRPVSLDMTPRNTRYATMYAPHMYAAYVCRICAYTCAGMRHTK